MSHKRCAFCALLVCGRRLLRREHRLNLHTNAYGLLHTGIRNRCLLNVLEAGVVTLTH